MAAFLDGCRFNPAAGGTTDWTYSSVVTGYQSPAAANVVNGRLYKYRAESADLSQWELGEGAYNTGTGVLARTTVLYNSSGTTTKVNFSTVPQVAVVALKEDLISVEEGNAFTSAQQTQARLNIGINQNVALSASQNFNSVTAPGAYYTIDNGSTNAPVSAAYWYLFVELYGTSTNYFCQTATRLDTAGAATYTRTCVNGTWGAWVQQAVGAPGQLVGTSAADAASPGNIGEEGHGSGSVSSYSNGISAQIMTLTIPSAGDWDVYGFNDWAGSGSTTTTDWQTIISTYPNPTASNSGSFPLSACHNRMPLAADIYLRQTIGPVRFSIAAATTLYMYGTVVISASNGYQSTGYMRYRRAR